MGVGPMKGETILLTTRHQDGTDDAGDTIWADDEPQQVDDVLVIPGATTDSTEATRPDGVTVAATLLFPRTFPFRSLRNASVQVRGTAYRVIGDPIPINGGITPTRWNLSVEVERGEG